MCARNGVTDRCGYFSSFSTGRNAGPNSTCRQIPHDYGTGTDDSVITYASSGENHRTSPNQTIFANPYPTAKGRIWRDMGVVANPAVMVYHSPVINNATIADIGTRTDDGSSGEKTTLTMTSPKGESNSRVSNRQQMP